MVELVDSVDLGSTAHACRFESCCPHQTKQHPVGVLYYFRPEIRTRTQPMQMSGGHLLAAGLDGGHTIIHFPQGEVDANPGLVPAPNKDIPNQLFPIGDGFGLFVFIGRYEQTYFANGVPIRPESKPRGPRKKKLI